MTLYKGVALSQGLIYTKRVHLGLSKVTFIEGCSHVRGGLYDGFLCIVVFKLECPPQKEVIIITNQLIIFLGNLFPSFSAPLSSQSVVVFDNIELCLNTI